MRITKLLVNLSAVISTAAYNNYKPMYQLEAEVTEGENPQENLQQLREIIRKMFAQDWSRLREKDKTEYLNKCRFYEKNNARVPSVTSILGWAELMYKLRNPEKFEFGGVDEDTLLEYAARGTTVHRGVEQWFHDTKGVYPAPIDYKFQTVFPELKVEETLLQESKLQVEDCNWLGFWGKYGEKIKIKFMERIIWGKGYAGKLDIYGTWDGKPAVFDVKTASAYTPRKELQYFKQMAAYARGLTGVKKPELLVIIPLTPKNKCGFGEPRITENSEGLFNSFMSDLKLFQSDFKDLI